MRRMLQPVVKVSWFDFLLCSAVGGSAEGDGGWQSAADLGEWRQEHLMSQPVDTSLLACLEEHLKSMSSLI